MLAIYQELERPQRACARKLENLTGRVGRRCILAPCLTWALLADGLALDGRREMCENIARDAPQTYGDFSASHKGRKSVVAGYGGHSEFSRKVAK